MKNGNSKPIYIVVAVFLVFVVIITSINMVTKDERNRMTAITESKFIFNNMVMELDEMYWDKNDELGELKLKKSDVFFQSDDWTISIKDQNGETLQTELIKEETVQEDDVFQTDVNVRFDMSKEIWYIQVEIAKEDISYQFNIDYRDFTKVNLKK